MTRRRKRHSPEQIVKKLRDADAMRNAGQHRQASDLHTPILQSSQRDFTVLLASSSDDVDRLTPWQI